MFQTNETAAILTFQTNKIAAVYQENPVGVEPFSYVNAFLCVVPIIN